MSFDENTGSLVGFGERKLPSGAYAKTLLKFDTVQYKEVLIGDVPSKWQGEMGAIAAVDSPNRLHYSLLMEVLVLVLLDREFVLEDALLCQF
jgi:hypothetical protein